MTPTKHVLLATTLFAGFSALAPQMSQAATVSPVTQRLASASDDGGAAIATATAVDGVLAQAQAGSDQGAPSQAKKSDQASDGPIVKEVVVTGSRIPRSRTSTDQPVAVITRQDVDERGFENLADALNELPSAGAGITPIGPQNSFGTGRNYIDLFGLGSNHTLTLVNGLRFVGDNPNNFFSNTSGGTQVDLNALPTLFLDNIDTVYATGAAVYGTDAVAGVVNVQLTKHFVGEEFVAQSGISTYGDIPRYSVEAAIGHDFNIGGGRLNVAIDFQYDKTNALNENDRPWLSQGLGFVPNPNGTPYQIVVPNFRYPSITPGGVPFNINDNYSPFTLNGQPNGQIVEFGPNGNLVPENIGKLYGGYTYGDASGGEGLNLNQLTSLQVPIDRKVFTGMINYDITPHLHWNTTVFYSDNIAVETANQPNYNAVFFGYSPACNAPSQGGSLMICGDNAFLTDQAKQVLGANGVTLAANTPAFFLSRQNTDITPDPISSYVHTLDIASTLSGDFNAVGRKFDWNISVSRGDAWSFFHQEGIIYGGAGVPNLFGYALDSVMVNGTPECRVKAQNPTSTDPYIANCVPYDPFGSASSASNAAAVKNFTTAFDEQALNQQDDILGNIGTSLFKLPAGDVKINLGYEYRREFASFSPNQAAEEGIGYSVPIFAQRAAYETSEYYTEVRAPILGGDFTFPLGYRLDLDAAYRDVESSLAGTNKAWSYGLNYQPIRDITIRGSRSKTFAAPSLGQAYSPDTKAYDTGADPCTTANITQGPNPAVRQKNCAAAFAALGADLATFSNSIVQNATIPVTSGGNDTLKNEIGNSFTYGVVLQPRFIPGLTATADYISVKIANAIEYFGVGAEMEECYDSPSPSPACSQFQRAQGTGQVVSAQESYVNAGYNTFAAANYSVTYDRNIKQIPGVNLLPFVRSTSDAGRFSMNVNAVNIRSYDNSVSGLGFDLVNYAGTIGTPRWRWQAAFNYTRGPLRLGWVSHYIGPSLYSLTTTAEDQSVIKLKSDLTHDFSASYKITQNVRLQLNVNNVFNTAPPSPVGTYSVGYYDFIGRYFEFSLRGKF